MKTKELLANSLHPLCQESVHIKGSPPTNTHSGGTNSDVYIRFFFFPFFPILSLKFAVGVSILFICPEIRF